MVTIVQIVPKGTVPNLSFDNPSAYHSETLLAPNGLYIVKTILSGEGSNPHFENPGKEGLDNFKSGSFVAFASGRIDYFDIFGTKHWTIFCYRMSQTLIWETCADRNDADTN